MYEQLITIILVAVVLGMDAFSLSMGMGLKGVSPGYELKFSGIVALLHVVMPLVGLNLGITVGKFMGIWAGRVGALILIYIGMDLLIKGYRSTRPQTYKFGQGRKGLDPAPVNREDWWPTLLLGVSVSMDALTVGFGLGTLKMPVFITVIITGSVAGIMTYIGFIGGRIFSRLIGSYAQIAGGIILLGLAVKLAF